MPRKHRRLTLGEHFFVTVCVTVVVTLFFLIITYMEAQP